MNAPARFDTALPRKRFTVDDVLAMQAAGIFGDFEKVELLEGDLVPMRSKLDRHEIYKAALNRLLARRLSDDFDLFVEPTLYAHTYSAPDPDIMVLDARWTAMREVTPEQVKLVIEVADTSLVKDLGVKARIYARFGVTDYWVVDVKTPRLIVHRGPSGDDWKEVRRLSRSETIAPLAFPDIEISLARLVPNR